jgi:hypothetical protein
MVEEIEGAPGYRTLFAARLAAHGAVLLFGEAAAVWGAVDKPPRYVVAYGDHFWLTRSYAFNNTFNNVIETYLVDAVVGELAERKRVPKLPA